MIRNENDDGWAHITEIGSGAGSTGAFLDEQNRRMARTTKQQKEYARLLQRVNNTSGQYCVQCNVISHAKNLCDLQNGNRACSKCIKSRRPCAKLVVHDGETNIGWLPLPEQARVGLTRQDRGYWTPSA